MALLLGVMIQFVKRLVGYATAKLRFVKPSVEMTLTGTLLVVLTCITVEPTATWRHRLTTTTKLTELLNGMM